MKKFIEKQRTNTFHYKHNDTVVHNTFHYKHNDTVVHKSKVPGHNSTWTQQYQVNKMFQNLLIFST